MWKCLNGLDFIMYLVFYEKICVNEIGENGVFDY